MSSGSTCIPAMWAARTNATRAVSGSISRFMASSEVASARWNAGSALAGCGHPSPTRNAARSSTPNACPSSSVDLDRKRADRDFQIRSGHHALPFDVTSESHGSLFAGVESFCPIQWDSTLATCYFASSLATFKGASGWETIPPPLAFERRFQP
jgi:hypothetical protein